jgi:ABC-type sugar transport system substrate-binding protein
LISIWSDFGGWALFLQIRCKERGVILLKRTLFALMTLAILLGVSSTASAQKTTVIRVVIVKTDNPAAYAQALEEVKAITKKAGSTNIHVYQATYAGPTPTP